MSLVDLISMESESVLGFWVVVRYLKNGNQIGI